jgi:hypothetical protein
MFTVIKMLNEFERKVVLRKLIAEALAAQVPRTTVENAVKNYSNVLDRIEALVEIREVRGSQSPAFRKISFFLKHCYFYILII